MSNSLRTQCAFMMLILFLLVFTCHSQAESTQGDCGICAQGATPADYEPFFAKCAMNYGFDAGYSQGVSIFGGRLEHDFVLGSVYLGRILSDTWFRGCFNEGDWEGQLRLFGGYQLNHGGAALFGLTPVIRYNFTSHSCWLPSGWIPFAEGGAGVTFADISRPDLSSDFNFNIQVGVGVRKFLCRNLAATFETRFVHISNARTDTPDLGVNSVAFTVGLDWLM
jgi:hypothetical protein